MSFYTLLFWLFFFLRNNVILTLLEHTRNILLVFKIFSVRNVSHHGHCSAMVEYFSVYVWLIRDDGFPGVKLFFLKKNLKTFFRSTRFASFFKKIKSNFL